VYFEGNYICEDEENWEDDEGNQLDDMERGS